MHTTYRSRRPGRNPYLGSLPTRQATVTNPTILALTTPPPRRPAPTTTDARTVLEDLEILGERIRLVNPAAETVTVLHGWLYRRTLGTLERLPHGRGWVCYDTDNDGPADIYVLRESAIEALLMIDYVKTRASDSDL